jgi:hypothetical protein
MKKRGSFISIYGDLIVDYRDSKLIKNDFLTLQ